MLGEAVLLCWHNDVLKFLGVEEGFLSQNTWWICHPDLGSRHLTLTCQKCKIYLVKHLVLCVWTPEQFHAPQDPQDLWVSSWIYKILMDENWPEWIIGNVGCLFVCWVWSFKHGQKNMKYSWYSHIFLSVEFNSNRFERVPWKQRTQPSFCFKRKQTDKRPCGSKEADLKSA